MERLRKPVREFLRCSDMLFAEFRDHGRFTEDELNVLRNYTLRLQSYLVVEEAERLHQDSSVRRSDQSP
ncbi:MAG TPA: hypothetical protein VJV04_02635 [Nitrospiraceae bacterium]|nr:hypothetical protein [Nitrospiraceae bacterium]